MKFLKILEKVIDVIGCIALVLIVILTSANIFTNWISHMRYPALDDLVNTFFVCVTYISTGILYKNGEHITVDFVVDSMPLKVQKFVNLFVDVFCLCISCILTKLSWELAMKSMKLTTPSMKIPYTIIDIPLIVGFATMVLAIVVKLFLNIMKMFGGKENA